MKILKKFWVAFFISLLWLNLSEVTLAAPQQISAEGEYHIGDRDTREDAKQAALADAKRKIAEQAGVFIESYTEVNNFQVSQDQIKIFTKALMKIKSERVEFTENGTTCHAYVTAVIDVDKLNDMVPRPASRPEPVQPPTPSEPDKPAKIEPPSKPDKSRDKDKAKDKDKKSRDRQSKDKFEDPSNIFVNFEDLENQRMKMVTNLSRATSYTAAAEYKLQEVTGITDIGNYAEKGKIANYLRENFEMNGNYRFAELTPFVEEAGAKKIIKILNDLHKQKNQDAIDRMTWAKIERTRAKSCAETAAKEAKAFFDRLNKLLNYAEDEEKDRLKVFRLEADDALKLIKALEVRNKAVDDVAKKYEKANKIDGKDPKSKKK